MPKLVNLTAHLLEQHGHNPTSRDLAAIINQVVFASKLISRDINKAGLADILGSTGQFNVQAEEVQKLDAHANQLLVELLSGWPRVRAIGSEEIDAIIDLPEHKNTGCYVIMLDPLDGSSNIDVNVSVGTIFSIFKIEPCARLTKKQYLLGGDWVTAAGYVLYGSSTMLVFSSGYGVHGFTLDPSIGEFLLSHPHLRFPDKSSVYSINEAYSPRWSEELRGYIDQAKTDRDVTGKPKKARYIGSLVSDFHRNLLTGGVYLYPGDAAAPQGKLRLMFEAIPMAFLAHQAGGRASDGRRPILELRPRELHQRTPLYIGDRREIAHLEKVLAGA